MEETMTMTRRLTVGAAAAALIFVVTLFVKVPIPLGYANLGDGVIFLAAVFLPRKEAALAAAVGSALADLMGGFPVWIIPTLIIKYSMVEIVARTARDRTSWRAPSVILGWVLASVWDAAAYTLAGAAIYGSLAVGLTSLPALSLSNVANMAAAYAAGFFVAGTRFFGK